MQIDLHFNRLVPTALAVWLLVTWSAMAHEEFRWKLSPGDRLSVTINQASETQSVCETVKRISGNEIAVEIDWTVTAVEDDIVQIRQTIKRIQIRLATPTADGSNQVEIDTSANAAARPKKGVELKVLDDLNSLIGVSVDLSMNTRGEILDLRIAEDDLQKIRQAGSQTPLLNLMSVEGMQDLFRASSFVLPEEPLNPGATWEHRRTSESPFGKFTTKESFEFAGEVDRDGRKQLQFASKTTVDQLPERPANVNPVDPPPELREISGQGTYWFDPERGIFTEANTNSVLRSRKSFRDLVVNTTITSRASLIIERR